MREQSGVLVAGDGRAARSYARLIREMAPAVPCFFWCENARRARRLNRALAGNGWFNCFDAAVQDERIAVVVLATPQARRWHDVAVALAAGKLVTIRPEHACAHHAPG